MLRVVYHSLLLALIGAATGCAAAAGPGAVASLSQARDSARVAVAQIRIEDSFLKAGHDPLDALTPYIERAGRECIDLLVFPEYLFGWFHLPDARTERLCALARQHNVNFVVGGWEALPGQPITHPPAPGTYANTLLVASRDGRIAGTHRKMHAAIGAGSPYCWPPAPGERGEQTMVLGEENGVVDLDFGRIGLLTCYDGYFFESFIMPSLRGAEVLVWVNSRAGMVEPHIIQAASFITCTHMVASNQSIGCGSAICSYPGWRLDTAEPKPQQEAWLVATLDLKKLRLERRNNRMLHQRRPAVYGPLAQAWRPWEAYPELPEFQYPALAGPKQ